MRIGLIDVDGHNFPNLALMKISAHHKALGDSVEFADPMFGEYGIIYQSKVFTFTPDDTSIYRAGKVVKAGTGYGDYATVLPEHIEHICPDYDLYLKTDWYDGDTAYGFLTRGCIRRCPWCIVPRKEGQITTHADIDEFIADKKKAVLLDNNVLASEWGLQQIEKIAGRGIRVDFNQGLDARIIAANKDIARLLGRVKWLRYIRMAFDDSRSEKAVFRAIDNLVVAGVPTSKMFFYTIVGDDLADAEKRVLSLKEVGATPFAQPYRDFENNTPTGIMQRGFARWVNHKAVFKTCTWEEYKRKTNISTP